MSGVANVPVHATMKSLKEHTVSQNTKGEHRHIRTSIRTGTGQDWLLQRKIKKKSRQSVNKSDVKAVTIFEANHYQSAMTS